MPTTPDTPRSRHLEGIVHVARRVDTLQGQIIAVKHTAEGIRQQLRWTTGDTSYQPARDVMGLIEDLLIKLDEAAGRASLINNNLLMYKRKQ